MVEPQDIIKFLRSKKYEPMNARALAEHFVVEEAEFEEFCRLLRNLELQGDIVQIKQKQYAIPSRVHLVVGTLRCNPRGYGFVVPLKEGGSDIYIEEEDMGPAMHGDLVVARVPQVMPPRRRGRKRGASGQIVNVLQHVNETIVGAFQRTRRLSYVSPDNPCLFRDIYVAEEDAAGAKAGQKVLVKVVQWPSRHLNPEGIIVEILGEDGDPFVDAISVAYEFQLPYRFEPETVAEASGVPQQVSEEECAGRLDLRNKDIITIDPEDAKDFDDAISLDKDARGHWHLGVHIADVSHYVREASPLDIEARKRGTSVYFPGQAIPMLPEALSSGICSLKQGEDRLTKSVLFEYGPKGKLLSSKIRYSVIRVSKRLTYEEAGRILRGDKEACSRVPEGIKKMLFDAAELAQVLYARRLERGALELDLPEVEIKLDKEGRVIGVHKVERDVSHKLIEEFMLAANEAVARFMHELGLPYFSRIHPEPDEEELLDFAGYMSELEHVKIDPFKRNQLQGLLKKVSGRPESYMVSLALLKSLKRAEYSGQWGPHFALAMDYYTHFTSPIRRYPDLLVHRILDKYILDGSRPEEIKLQWEDRLEDWARHCSTTERKAEEAEREITKLKLLRYLEDRIGEVMEGVITGVEEFGFFVQLKEYLLDGLIHVRNLADDFYKLDRRRMALVGNRRGKVYRVGGEIKVKIDKIDLLKREVDFIRAN